MQKVRRVLGAVSLYTPSPKAVLAAAEVAAVFHADLTVLTVLRDPWELVRPDEVEAFRRARSGSPADLAAARAVERLQALCAPAVLPAPSASYRAAFGWPSIEIARCAEEIGADLIVLGKGEEVTRGAAENVTTATMRRSRVPVLVAPAQHRTYRRVLACVDDSPHAVEVLEVAQAAAEGFGAHLAALHVEPAESGVLSSEERRPWLRYIEQSGTGGAVLAPCEAIVRQGDVTTEILAECRAEDAELLVFGYRRGMNYGDPGAVTTVTARLLRRASCGLLAVPV
ncbi:MAG TPA: universal stress protein [Gemmatimonadales bacterium]|nr:universal stress protein [Gemmatimonadales bacterium]